MQMSGFHIHSRMLIKINDCRLTKESIVAEVSNFSVLVINFEFVIYELLDVVAVKLEAH